MLKGHERQGYCQITETAGADGTVSETLGTGVITSHVVNFTGTRGTSSTDVYAGDTLEDSEDETTGDVKFELSQLPLKDEAAFGGHNYDTAKDLMTEADSDSAPFFRYGAIGLGRRGATKADMKNFYRLLMYYKVKFGPVDDTLQTKEEKPTYKSHSVSGRCYPNAGGKIREKQDFDTFEAAIAAMKTFLNITTG